MNEGYALSIDQGTTGSTVLIFDHEGQVRSRAYSEFTQHYPKPGWVEHDAEEIVLVTFKVIAEAIRNSDIRASDIQAIGITNQRETVVLWDRKTGRSVAHAIVWQDRRTARYCDQLKEQGHEEMFRRKTGLVIDPYFSGTKVKRRTCTRRCSWPSTATPRPSRSSSSPADSGAAMTSRPSSCSPRFARTRARPRS
ncbi:hypothetical protein G3480_04050 [Thiorhodococcus mannitoliphagus]|uniref:Carbohydrate kinase FGGY N-terminal domain-containing protein n=1 Tax=Thiorhodococcus mannitoliphagus TaxID=329406 RepID=A0A6P1DUW9_9GAMM|nr:FGGY family carbohydrate kinase [Thiorhodococcus mannitoliphagus]NEX19494.1 hypothetical protein [Thiorhodococcus mannitoliphagus]